MIQLFTEHIVCSKSWANCLQVQLCSKSKEYFASNLMLKTQIQLCFLEIICVFNIKQFTIFKILDL